VDADCIRAVGKKILVGTMLVVGAGNPDPEHDFACQDRPCEMSGVPGNEPTAESIFQAGCSCTKPFAQTIRQGARRAGDRLSVVWKRIRQVEVQD